MKSKAFIKLQRELLSQPQVVDLLAEEGAAGLGIYVTLNLYLAHCEGGWGIYTGRQLSSLAIQLKKHRSDVNRVICNYGLFVIEGSRFTSLWMQQQFPKDSAKMLHSRPYISMRAEDIELDEDIEKEKKKKCVCLNDTHSQFEVLRAGRRYASHGQPLPGDVQVALLRKALARPPHPPRTGGSQEIVFYPTKDYLSSPKRLSFALQKTIFRKIMKLPVFT